MLTVKKRPRETVPTNLVTVMGHGMLTGSSSVVYNSDKTVILIEQKNPIRMDTGRSSRTVNIKFFMEGPEMTSGNGELGSKRARVEGSILTL